MTSIVNKSGKIECCVNIMFQIIQNMMVSQGLELELSMFRRTTISGQHPLDKMLRNIIDCKLSQLLLNIELV